MQHPVPPVRRTKRVASNHVTRNAAWYQQDSSVSTPAQGPTLDRPKAAVGTLIFFLLAPGIVAGLIPWWLTGWRVRQALPGWAFMPARVAGTAFIVVAGVVLVQAFVRFVAEGVGTPAPIAPTQRLVVGGLYRYVRNPMYLAVIAIIVGQALVLGQPVLLAYAAAVGIAMAAFAHGYEEPVLADRFGAQYETYRRAVPAWWPRRHPWEPGDADTPTSREGNRDVAGDV
jgi:protein-S-isoprenylcysteine O-methyltransferase Ste14